MTNQPYKRTQKMRDRMLTWSDSRKASIDGVVFEVEPDAGWTEQQKDKARIWIDNVLCKKKLSCPLFLNEYDDVVATFRSTYGLRDDLRVVKP